MGKIKRVLSAAQRAPIRARKATPNHAHDRAALRAPDFLEIILNRGKTAKFDREDFKLINQYRWVCKQRGNTWYANSRQSNRFWKSKQMHHVVLGINKINNPLEPGMVVDHINGNGLDNRKSNLRIITSAENTYRSKFRPIGERHGSAKLTEEKIRKIRELAPQYIGRQAELSPIFGVGRSQIGRIVRGEHWKFLI